MERADYLARVQRAAQDLQRAANPPGRPALRVVGNANGTECAVTRRYLLRRIRWLAEAYGLGWQIDQATVGHPLDSLDDDGLRALLSDMEHGRRCCVEGVGFDDAGLVREARNYD